MLMNRNLLYTALTRAKKCVVLIGDSSVMSDMIDNTNEQERYTALALRMTECRKEGKEQEAMRAEAGKASEAAKGPDGDDEEDPFAWMDEVN